MRYPLREGDSYDQLDTTLDLGDLDGDGRNDPVALTVDNTVIGLEAVSTPAGSFSGALHQRQVIRVAVSPTGGSGRVTVTTTIDTWYGKDIGPLQSQVRIVGAGVDETVTEALTAYGVGGRRSETVAPTVLSVTPGATPVRSLFAAVRAEFSEPVDPASLGSATFTVRDGAGNAVPGSVSLQGNTAGFMPTAMAWAGGSYTATVDGVRDRVGNVLAAPRSWTFVIDDTAPGVVASTPAMNGLDVPLAGSIVVDFSEDLDPAGVVATNVTLVDDVGTALPAALALTAARLTVTPSAPLLPGRDYQLRLSGLYDRAGNAMPGHVLMFKTLQGRFSYRTNLIPGVWAYANAVGDVNGDGIADVLVATLPNAPAPYSLGLFVLPGRADGTLGAPQRLDLGPQFGGCAVSSMVIGDVDGDGRADVVVGGGGACGMQVLRQSPAHALVPAEYLATAGGSRLRLADLDNDGKLDLVSVGGGNQVYLWKRGPGGALVESGSFSFGFAVYDVDVGDLDGDGRPDIALVLSSGPIGNDLGVVYQQADGTFGTGVVLATGSSFGLARIAIGDMNGDGRADLYAAAVDRLVGYHQTPGGTLAAPVIVPTSGYAQYLDIADLDNDGKADLVVGHLDQQRIGVYWQRSGGLAAEEIYAAPPLEFGVIHPFALGDVNGDGRRDIVVNGSLLRQLPGVTMAAQRGAEPPAATLAARASPGRRAGEAVRGAFAAAAAGPR